MCTHVAMQMVTSFGEADPESDVDPLEEYGQIFQALSHNLTVAENVFARVAKKSLKQRLGEQKMAEAKDARGMIPTWVTESSVSLVMPGAETKADDWYAALDSLIEGTAYHLQESVRDRVYVLIDPLTTRIQQIGENLFKFSVKQKWALENSEKPDG